MTCLLYSSPLACSICLSLAMSFVVCRLCFLVTSTLTSVDNLPDAWTPVDARWSEPTLTAQKLEMGDVDTGMCWNRGGNSSATYRSSIILRNVMQNQGPGSQRSGRSVQKKQHK